MYISNINNFDVQFALKNLKSPHNLKYSRILRSQLVSKYSRRYNLEPTEALSQLLDKYIYEFKPKEKLIKRTIFQLRYEILRMIAYEGATESQIMWDLKFDVYTRSVEQKISEGREPRFKLKDASEYSATSSRSFKRLKKEAIEMLRWKLEEGEK